MLSCKHIMTVSDMTAEDIVTILDTAESFMEVNERRIKKLPTLRGRTVVNLFLEPSTRTRTSFEIAAKRLSADGINFTASSSATVKGESLRDTAKTLAAMACDLVVIRHKYAGAPQMLTECMDAHIVNGGDGVHEHPTQALLDLFTMRRTLGKLAGLRVGIVGDISHSRVAGSLVPALRKVGATHRRHRTADAHASAAGRSRRRGHLLARRGATDPRCRVHAARAVRARRRDAHPEQPRVREALRHERSPACRREVRDDRHAPGTDEPRR